MSRNRYRRRKRKKNKKEIIIKFWRKNMKIETLELIIEELSAALTLERWRTKTAEAEISRLEKELDELKKENYNG